MSRSDNVVKHNYWLNQLFVLSPYCRAVTVAHLLQMSLALMYFREGNVFISVVFPSKKVTFPYATLLSSSGGAA